MALDFLYQDNNVSEDIKFLNELELDSKILKDNNLPLRDHKNLRYTQNLKDKDKRNFNLNLTKLIQKECLLYRKLLEYINHSF